MGSCKAGPTLFYYKNSVEILKKKKKQRKKLFILCWILISVLKQVGSVAHHLSSQKHEKMRNVFSEMIKTVQTLHEKGVYRLSLILNEGWSLKYFTVVTFSDLTLNKPSWPKHLERIRWWQRCLLQIMMENKCSPNVPLPQSQFEVADGVCLSPFCCKWTRPWIWKEVFTSK